MACRTLVPPPGIKPTSPTLQGRFVTTDPPGKSPEAAIEGKINHFFLKVKIKHLKYFFSFPRIIAFQILGKKSRSFVSS